MLPKMDSFFNARDIFLWADGYWCYREEFYQQLRQAYTYRLLQVGSPEWHALRGGYPVASRPVPPQRHRAGSVSARP
jgi:hypothetical protein